MDPVRNLFNILVIITAITMILFLLLYRREGLARNPLIVMIIAFLTTMILWLAFLGASALFSGYRLIQISPQMLVILILLASILLLSIFRPGVIWRRSSVIILILGSAWILLISALAIFGLSFVTAWYVRENLITWVIASLSLALILQLALLFQNHRRMRGGQNGEQEFDATGEDHTGREN